MTVMLQGDTSVMTHMYTYIAKGGLYMDTSDPQWVMVYICICMYFYSPTPLPHPQVSRNFDLSSDIADLQSGGMTVLKPVGPVRIQFKDVSK